MPHNTGISSKVREGYFVYWRDSIYIVDRIDKNRFQIYLKDMYNETLISEDIAIFLGSSDNDPNTQEPVCAPTREELEEKLHHQAFFSDDVYDAALPDNFVSDATEIVKTVKAVRKLIDKQRRLANSRGEKIRKRQAIEIALRELDLSISWRTFYNWEKRYKAGKGQINRIAANMRRSTYRTTKFTSSERHLLHTVILRYSHISNTKELFGRLQQLHKENDGLWIDANKCDGDAPEKLIEELLDPDIPIALILENPESAELLKKVKIPGRTWFYNYMKYFKSLPGGGKQVLDNELGEGAWDRQYRAFETFVHRASYPLQYVFIDHYKLDIFSVDEETRSELSRLWLTVLIDAYSRAIIGYALLYEDPSIESVTVGTKHAIFPKISHKKYDIEKPWICYGIPAQLSLDNAWAHHSYTLEEIATRICENEAGEQVYPDIKLVYRPPYMARYGALVERFFGHLANKMRRALPGAIKHGQAKNIQNSARSASLIYDDVDEYINKFIVNYMHTPHSELNGMTPHEKWLEGSESGVISDIPSSKRLDRLFWRKFNGTRTLSNGVINLWRLRYSHPELSGFEKKHSDGTNIKYSIRYSVDDISRIALYRDGKYLTDLLAQQFKLPDGSYRQVSLVEWEMAKALGRGKGIPIKDWIELADEFEDRARIRMKERKAAHRKSKRFPGKKPPASTLDESKRTLDEIRQDDIDDLFDSDLGA